MLTPDQLLGCVEEFRPPAPRIIVLGRKGAGKSTYLAQFPRPLVFDFEEGFGTLRVPVCKPKTGAITWDFLKQSLDVIIKNPQKFEKFQTIAIDTLDSLESACTRELCRLYGWQSLQSAPYGQGYGALSQALGDIRRQLSDLSRQGKIVVVSCHAEPSTYDDPDEKEGRKIMQLTLTRQKDCDGFTGWCDVIVYIRQITGTNDRMYTCNPSDGHIAKTRYTLPPGAAADPDRLLAACGWDATRATN